MVKIIAWLLVLFASFAFGFLAVADAQASPKALLSFIAPQDDINGVPTTYIGLELRVVAKGGGWTSTALKTLKPTNVMGGPNVIDLTSTLADLPAGTYDVLFKLRNVKGYGAAAGPARFDVPLGLVPPTQPGTPATTPMRAQKLSVTIEKSPPPIVPSVTLFNDTDKPALQESPEAVAYELGVRFKASVAGTVRSIRFYKGPTNVGPHSVHLWNDAGVQLASVDVSEETPTGWQSATIPTPVSIESGKVYTASYFCPKGHYAVTPNGFAAAKVSGVLTAGVNAGVFKQGTSPGFPTSTYLLSNYWVDLSFDSGVANVPPPPDPPPVVLVDRTLFWTPPTIDEDGKELKDLAGYVMRYGKLETDLSAWAIIGLVNEFNLRMQTGPHWFEMKAVDKSGNESKTSALVRIDG